MAEFGNVMVGYTRMCKYMNQECYERRCPLAYKAFCTKPICAYTQEDIQEAEEIIAKWVAEHPEPVYPTWLEWFKQQNIWRKDTDNPALNLYNPIPADIAEKLGIEPKR